MKKMKGTIQYKMKSFHPDVNEDTDLDSVHTYEDIFRLDTDRFFNETHMINHITSELIMVASGGYDSKYIYDIKFDIYEV